jgi:cysteine synthase
MENLNPGGTGKDRAAWSMIRAAEASGMLPTLIQKKKKKKKKLDEIDVTMSRKDINADTNSTNSKQNIHSNINHATGETTTCVVAFMDAAIQQAMQRSQTGGLVLEGTSGSTGISLASLCRVRGHACLVVLPDDQAVEKQTLLQTLGAVVHVVPTASISNPQHYVSIAQRMAHRAVTVHKIKTAVFINQFENPANVQVHYQETGPELYRQLLQEQQRRHSSFRGTATSASPVLSAFVMSAGTGGTIAGIGRYLKEQQTNGNKSCRIVLVDPPGSVLYHKIEHGVAYTVQQSEQCLKRHRYDTIAEGIGLDRITANVAAALPYIDQAMTVSDQEAVDMAHWLLRHEGLFCGSSSSINVVGAVRTALQLVAEAKIASGNEDHNHEEDIIVLTFICDGGQRHLTRFWNRDFCLSWGLTWPGDDATERIPDCLQQVF